MTSIGYLGLSLSLFILSVNHPAKGDPREEVARAFYAAAKYQEAIDIYAQLFAQYIHPDYIYNIGRCYQNMGDPDKALRSFHEFERKVKHMEPALRKELDSHIREMEALKAERERLAGKLGADTGGEPAATESAKGEKREAHQSAAGAASHRKPSSGSDADAVDAFLVRVHSEPESFWRARALDVDEEKAAKTAALVKAAKPNDPRLADYQFHLATLYAGKHFTLRLEELRAGLDDGQGSHKVATGERRLGPAIAETFTTAAGYYLAATEKKDFAKMDEALMGLAVLLQANNMESRARSVLLQLLRTLPNSKQSAAVRAAAAGDD